MQRSGIVGLPVVVVVALVAVLGPVVPAKPKAPSNLTGVWKTQEGEAHIEIEPCEGERLCGSIVWLLEPNHESGEPARDTNNPDPALRDRTILGLQILEVDAAPDEGGVHDNGEIYDPESGKTYRCKLWQDKPGRLKLRGFIGISLLGRTTEWTRVDAAPTPR